MSRQRTKHFENPSWTRSVAQFARDFSGNFFLLLYLFDQAFPHPGLVWPHTETILEYCEVESQLDLGDVMIRTVTPYPAAA